MHINYVERFIGFTNEENLKILDFNYELDFYFSRNILYCINNSDDPTTFGDEFFIIIFFLFRKNYELEKKYGLGPDNFI